MSNVDVIVHGGSTGVPRDQGGRGIEWLHCLSQRVVYSNQILAFGTLPEKRMEEIKKFTMFKIVKQ